MSLERTKAAHRESCQYRFSLSIHVEGPSVSRQLSCQQLSFLFLLWAWRTCSSSPLHLPRVSGTQGRAWSWSQGRWRYIGDVRPQECSPRPCHPGILGEKERDYVYFRGRGWPRHFVYFPKTLFLEQTIYPYYFRAKGRPHSQASTAQSVISLIRRGEKWYSSH